MSFVFRPVWQNQSTVVLKRIIGNQTLKRLDPFLLFDYFTARLPNGFTDHPHRGFQTVTYMKSGKVYHEDFKGHKGIIGPGDVQWMTAGKGIMHAQMPASSEQDSIGFQLWVNLKAKDKMKQPKYQEYRADQIPICTKNGVTVKLICGEWNNHKSPIVHSNPVYYMDVKMQKQTVFQLPVDKTWNSIIFPYIGQVEYLREDKNQKVKSFECCVLERSDQRRLNHVVKSKQGASLMVIAGQPLNQPVWTRRLFVMNSKEEVDQAQRDFKECKNGFENKVNWKSKIQLLGKGKKYQQL